MKIKWFERILPEPNGCGPRGFERLVPNLIFRRSCNFHDNLFSARVGFFTANWHFYTAMRHDIWLKKASCWYEIMAVIYFIMVTLLGAPFYFRWGTKIKRTFGKLFNIRTWK